MTKPITIPEYEYSDKLTKYIPYLKKINKIYSKTSNKEDTVFKIYGNMVRAKQFVGIIKVKNQTIQILPKILSFKDNNKTNDDSDIIQNLLFMLKYTKKLDLKETDFTDVKKHKDLFEVMIYLFAKNFLELLKFNLYKNYELQEGNLNYLKGKLKLKEHLSKNIVNKAKFYCGYDEFLEDNLLNQIFKATIVKLIKITKSNDTYKLLITCNLILNEVSLKRISFTDITKVKFTRFNNIYKSSFNLAKLLLFGNSIELSFGDVSTFSMLFDMNKLFEEFIYEFIKKEISYKEKFIIKSQTQNKKVFKKSDIGYFYLKPDILIYNSNSKYPKLIIDTKYKILNKNKSHKGVSSSDIYQMIVYGMRYFKGAIKEKKIILLYPKPFNSELNTKIGSSYTEENINIEIRTVNLNINLKQKKDILVKELKRIIADKEVKT